MKVSKGKRFWFKSAYDFKHASGEIENLNNRVFKVSKIRNKFIYATDRKGIIYVFELLIKNYIQIEDKKLF